MTPITPRGHWCRIPATDLAPGCHMTALESGRAGGSPERYEVRVRYAGAYATRRMEVPILRESVYFSSTSAGQPMTISSVPRVVRFLGRTARKRPVTGAYSRMNVPGGGTNRTCAAPAWKPPAVDTATALGAPFVSNESNSSPRAD